MKTVLVIGGGVTGLAAMYELSKWKRNNNIEVRLILAESAAELGGKIRTIKDTEFIMETGADSLVARKANSMSFIQELGLEDEVVYNATGQSFIYTDSELKPIPPDSLFGIPLSIESLAKTTLVSANGKVEALKDFYTTNDRFTKDSSIGEFLEYFLGKELVEKQIAPVLSGVYSGNINDLTIGSTLPYLIDYKEKYGSLIKGFEVNKEKFQSGSGKKFLTFRNGLSTLINAIAQRLTNVELLKKYHVSKLEKLDSQYRVTFQNNEQIEVDHVVLSIPHNSALDLVDLPLIRDELSKLKTSSLISVYVGYDIPDDQLPFEGTGYISASPDELACNACTWTSRKWTHTSKNSHLLVRLFYKSSHPSFEDLREMTREQLLAVAKKDIEKSLHITANPISSEVTKWTDQMPNYLINHQDVIKKLETEFEKSYPGVFLAGCSYYGVGIPDCMENGKNTALKVINAL